jgi:hypothetical protein
MGWRVRSSTGHCRWAGAGSSPSCSLSHAAGRPKRKGAGLHLLPRPAGLVLRAAQRRRGAHVAHAHVLAGGAEVGRGETGQGGPRPSLVRPRARSKGGKGRGPCRHVPPQARNTLGSPSVAAEAPLPPPPDGRAPRWSAAARPLRAPQPPMRTERRSARLKQRPRQPPSAWPAPPPWDSAKHGNTARHVHTCHTTDQARMKPGTREARTGAVRLMHGPGGSWAGCAV